MTDSPSQERICVHCGTPRPVDEPECPSCGKPWVDERIDDGSAAAVAASGAADASEASDSGPEDDGTPETDDASEAAPVVADPAEEAPDDATEELPAAAAAATAATAAAAGQRIDDTGEFTFDDWTLPPEAPRSRARWLIPIILLIAVVVVWALVFLDDDSTTATTVAQGDPVTTIAPTTTVETATTTTVAPTTTSSTTTTTIDFPPPSAWEPVGDPIPADELTLRQAAIGPLDFGDSITFVAGRLTASFGEAETATVEGLCPPDESYALQWGELLAIFNGFRSDAVFVSYRYEDIGSDRELGLTTLSGLALGDTVAELQSIYAQFDIVFETIDGRDHFRLLDGDELLLWGPVSGTDDDDVVEGIYSPSPCEDA